MRKGSRCGRLSAISAKTSNWRKVVSDTRDVATFAVGSSKCFQVQVEGILSNKCQENATGTGISTNLIIEKDVSEGGRVCICDIQLAVEKVWRDGDEERVVAAVGKNSLYPFLARRRWYVREQVHPEVTTGRSVRALLH